MLGALSVPLATYAVVRWLVRLSPGTRRLAALALLGWVSLLPGVGGVATAVATEASDEMLCLSAI